LWLGKKTRLRRCIVGIVKIAQPNANEAEPLPRLEADAFAKRQSDIRVAGELLIRA
jgi:hypothetical protein